MNSTSVLVPKPVFKKANIFKWLVIWGGGFFAKLMYKVHIDKAQRKAFKKIKEPMLILSNHQSPMDFALTTFAIRPIRPSVVVGVGVFFEKKVSGLVRQLKNNIPKKQFSTDYESVKNIKRMIDSGVSVLIFPEGRFSLAGYTGKIADTVSKMAKWLGVPVVCVRNNGAYLTRTRFLSGFKKGKIVTEINVAATAAELENMDAKELNERIHKYLDYNDFDYQEKNHLAFKNDKLPTTAGFEPIIYKCPKCFAENKMEAKDSSFVCSACDFSACLDEFGVISANDRSITINRIDKWYDFEYESLKKEISLDENYTLSTHAEATLLDPKLGDYIPFDEGTISLSKNGLFFEGKEKQLSFILPNPPVLTIPDINVIEIFDIENNLYKFNLLGSNNNSIKYSIATELLFELYCTDRRKR